MKFLLAGFFVFAAFIPPSAAVETTIKGERMELIDKGEEVLFSGGVRLDRGADTVLSNQMRTNKTRDRVEVKGNVRLTRKASSTETWKAFGETGFYNTKDGTGHLKGNSKRARLIRSEIFSATSTRTTEIFADRIDFFRDGQRAFAQGNVFGKTIDPNTGEIYEFRSQEAEHRGEEGRLVLTGPTEKPVITQTSAKGSKQITGKTIIYYIDSRRLVSKDGAEAVMRDEKKEEKPN